MITHIGARNNSSMHQKQGKMIKKYLKALKFHYWFILIVNLSLIGSFILNVIYFPVSLQDNLIVWYASLTLVEHTFGWFYAWKIYHWPITPTWVSVLWGTSLVMLTEMAAIGGTLYLYGLWSQLWFMIYFPAVTLALPGGPMAYLQQRKWREMTSKNQKILEVWEKNG